MRLVIALLALATPLNDCHGQFEPISTPVDDLVGFYSLDGARVRVTWRPDGGLYILALDPESTADDGPDMWSLAADDEGWPTRDGAPVEVERTADGAVRAILIPQQPGKPLVAERLAEQPYAQRQVAWTSSAGDIRLVGAIMIPAGEGPFPGAAIIQGSGASGRSNIWAWTFADGLALRGVATLIPDKRGSDASGGAWMDASFEDLAADAAASLEALRGLEGVDAQRCGFVGLSQGGWIAPLATAKSKGAFSASLSCALTRPGEQVQHELMQDFRSSDLSDEDARRMGAAIRAFGDFISGAGSWERYESLANPLRSGATAEIAAEYLLETPDAAIVGFWRRIHDYDFPGLLAAADAPRLLVYGTEDELDNTPVALSLRRLADLYAQDPRIDLRTIIYPSMGHALADERTKWVSPVVLADLAAWVTWVTGGS